MMGTKWRKRARRMVLVLFVAWLFAVLFAHPFFAVVRPGGGKALVAEGWMHRDGLQEAAKLFREGGYEHLYLTGTPRPFAYYLHAGDTIEVRFSGPLSGELTVGTAGLPGAVWSLTVDGRGLTGGLVTANIADTRTMLRNASGLRISASSHAPPPSGEPVLFIGRLWIDGMNVHALRASTTIHRADGSTEPGRPTFAHQAYFLLHEEGVPEERMTVVPTWTVDGSRTLSTARDLTAYAKAHGITAFDVATLGVHARRTRNMYRKAWGGKEGIGIIALHNQRCGRWTWWTTRYGWHRMMKELVAWPMPWLLHDDAEAPG